MLLAIYIFAVGLCIGSFLNVCIYRLPAGRSVIHPPSACPVCGHAIRFYDNIPVVSYLLLLGRCRSCRTPIPARYPVVELLTALFALAVWLQFGAHLDSLIYFVLIAALLAVTFIDLDHRIIPDVISLPGIAVGFAASFFLPQTGWLASLIGIVAGGGSLFAIAYGYEGLTGKSGMGGGDIKLLAMIGAFLGWQGVLVTVMVASLTGTIIGLMLMLRMRKGLKLAVPFGPFLSTGAIFYLFMGPRLIDWYLNQFLV